MNKIWIGFMIVKLRMLVYKSDWFVDIKTIVYVKYKKAHKLYWFIIMDFFERMQWYELNIYYTKGKNTETIRNRINIKLSVWNDMSY